MVVRSGSIDELREQYDAYIGYAFLAALLIHLLIFYFSPPFEFQPYTFIDNAPIKVIEFPKEIEVEPPPKTVPHPPVEIEPAAAGEEPTDVTIPENVPYGDDILTPVRSAEVASPEPFYYFDEPPALVRYVNPIYPDLSRQAGTEGTVLLSVLVGTDGRVVEVSVLRSDVTAPMERAAIAAACLFEFRPATQNTRPVKARISIPVVFRLN